VAGFSASTPSQNAVRWAAAEAERRATGLCIVHAYPLPQLGQPVQHDVDKLLRAEAADLLDRVAESTRRDHPHLEIINRLVQQAPVNALRSESVGATLTVVGARESSRLGGAILGSIASAVAAVNSAPVAVVHTDHPLNGSGPVLIGIDESGGSSAAIEFAFTEARLRKVALLAVHASSRLGPGDTPNGSPSHPDAAEVERGGAAVFSKGLASWRDKFPDVVVTASVRQGRAATVLLECGVSASLVVVGRRPRGEFEAMIMGSTSRSLTAHSACPVVIVGPGALLDHEHQ
jgi:nucleotide-binding universal stress UspA family protein